MSRGLVSRGDLLRSLMRHGGELSPQAVEALGYLAKRPEKQEKPAGEKGAGFSGEKEPEQQFGPLDSQAPPAPVPFWQPVSLVPDEIEHPDVSKGTAPAQPPIRALSRPPDYKYLASFKELVPRLRTALSEHRPSRAYDIPRIVSRIGRGETLHHLPRRHRTGWGTNLYVIEDRSNHLAPYVRDQAMVQVHLRHLYTTMGFHQALYSECYDKPQVFWPDGRVSSMEPQPGDQVLVLGDLGCLARDGGRAALFWAGFGEELRDRGVSVLALLPCAPAECPDTVAGYYHLLSWEHPAPKVLVGDEWEERGQQLLAHLSIVPRIEPRLLREIRLGLGAQKFPARMEAWAWQHPVMADPDMVVTALASEETLPRHKVFRKEENKALGIDTLRAAKDSMAHLPYELWLETAINFGDWDDEVISPRERKDGVALLSYLAGRVGSHGGVPLSARARGWLEDFYQRLSDEVKEAPETKDACWVLAGALAQDGKPRWLSPQPLHIHLYQRGGQIQLLQQQGSYTIGSRLAGINSRDGLIRLETLHESESDDFWQEDRAPAWAERWGRDAFGSWVEFLYQGVRQRMRWIAPGSFSMGSPPDEHKREGNEGPQHTVQLSHGYWLFDTAVTQALWQAVMGANPSSFKADDRPVEQVSWHDCQAFLDKINNAVPGLELNLPSEAQWEYACRAGTSTPFSLGEDIKTEQVNYHGDYPYRDAGKGEYRAETLPVTALPPNPWGLYQMHGNVWEWCLDGMRDYAAANVRDPLEHGRKAGALRVIRGGSWYDGAQGCRSAFRRWDYPADRLGTRGFRPARVQVSQAGAQPATPGVAAQAEPADHRVWRGGAVVLHLPSDRQTVAQAIPNVDRLRLRTDREILTLRRRTKPHWASAMGRDRFGLWAEFTLQASEGAVRQRLRWIPPGRFLMGSPGDKPGRDGDEGPQHEVFIRDGYWLFDTPVTQALWQAVMGGNPSQFKSPERPVEQVSWNACQEFLQQINAVIPELGLSLPSEAQWEYVCRAGSETAIYTGQLKIVGERNAPALDAIAWYGGNSGRDFELENGFDASDWPEKQYEFDKAGTHSVGQKAPNPWGLYDMLGNVWEWTADTKHENYQGAPDDGSAWDEDEAGAGRVVRGGSWNGGARDCRSACRDWVLPDFRHDPLGFRPARVRS